MASVFFAPTIAHASEVEPFDKRFIMLHAAYFGATILAGIWQGTFDDASYPPIPLEEGSSPGNQTDKETIKRPPGFVKYLYNLGASNKQMGNEITLTYSVRVHNANT